MDINDIEAGIKLGKKLIKDRKIKYVDNKKGYLIVVSNSFLFILSCF